MGFPVSASFTVPVTLTVWANPKAVESKKKIRK
jgi:hypothetical protein